MIFALLTCYKTRNCEHDILIFETEPCREHTFVQFAGVHYEYLFSLGSKIHRYVYPPNSQKTNVQRILLKLLYNITHDQLS